MIYLFWVKFFECVDVLLEEVSLAGGVAFLHFEGICKVCCSIFKVCSLQSMSAKHVLQMCIDMTPLLALKYTKYLPTHQTVSSFATP